MAAHLEHGLVRTDKVAAILNEILRGLGLKWDRVFCKVCQVNLESRFHRHFRPFIHVELVMPAVPELWKSGADLLYQLIEPRVTSLANKLVEEGSVTLCGAILIMLDLTMSHELIDKVLQWYAY